MMEGDPFSAGKAHRKAVCDRQDSEVTTRTHPPGYSNTDFALQGTCRWKSKSQVDLKTGRYLGWPDRVTPASPPKAEFSLAGGRRGIGEILTWEGCRLFLAAVDLEGP